MVFLEVKPDRKENDNTTDIMQLVENKVAGQMLNKTQYNVTKPRRMSFILTDEEKNENSTIFRYRYRSR